ncbi:hypothetical protein [Peribacillus deserti]|uniref:hypothetical protein n=1 Tax=Peribacillus deserti TaxID=673318 RepID=UPI0011590DFD|nr:hypothetical protein [Peribacillus deserti]
MADKDKSQFKQANCYGKWDTQRQDDLQIFPNKALQLKGYAPQAIFSSLRERGWLKTASLIINNKRADGSENL